MKKKKKKKKKERYAEDLRSFYLEGGERNQDKQIRDRKLKIFKAPRVIRCSLLLLSERKDSVRERNEYAGEK